MVTLVKGDLKAPFLIATTPKCRERHYSFPWIALLYPWNVSYNAVLSKDASSTIFLVFGMTWAEIELRSSRPLAGFSNFLPDAFLVIKFNCVMWYATERGKGKINPPTFCVWTNKPQGLTTKAVRMQVKCYQLSVTYDLMDREGSVGHYSCMTRWNREEEERGQMICPGL